MHALKCLIAR